MHTLTLSDAMRLGSMLKPQGHGSHATTLHADTACAIGAAALALGFAPLEEGDEVYDALKRRFPFTREMCICPVCRWVRPAFEAIWHLNDLHGWTREQIADWVATIEPQEDATRSDPPAPVGDPVGASQE